MRIFVSYASDDQTKAEPIALSLRNQGHAVFLDKNDLPPGMSYDDQIQQAIKQADLFIFLISSHSLSAGRYTLSELKFAQAKWSSPKGNLLPVLIEPVPYEQIPAYLKAVSILKPAGNVTAEVVHEVARLVTVKKSGGGFSKLVGLAVAISALIVTVLYLTIPPDNHDLGSIEVKSPDTKLIGKTAFSLPSLLDKTARSLATFEQGYFIGSQNPNKLVILSKTGDVLKTALLDGKPTAISYGPLGLFVATRGPNKILKFDPQTLAPQGKLEIDFPQSVVASFSEPPSVTPYSLAQDNSTLWLLTRDGENGAVLSHTDAKLSKLTIPPYYETVNFDLRDMHLRSGRDAVWGARNATTPSSLFSFTKQKHTEYKGHDFTKVSCSSDILSQQSYIVIVDCDDRLQTILPKPRKLDIRDDLGPTPTQPTSATIWATTFLAKTKTKHIVGINLSDRSSGQPVNSFKIAIINPNEEPKVIFARENMELIEFVAHENTTIVTMKSASGVFRTTTIAH